MVLWYVRVLSWVSIPAAVLLFHLSEWDTQAKQPIDQSLYLYGYAALAVVYCAWFATYLVLEVVMESRSISSREMISVSVIYFILGFFYAYEGFIVDPSGVVLIALVAMLFPIFVRGVVVFFKTKGPRVSQS